WTESAAGTDRHRDRHAGALRRGDRRGPAQDRHRPAADPARPLHRRADRCAVGTAPSRYGPGAGAELALAGDAPGAGGPTPAGGAGEGSGRATAGQADPAPGQSLLCPHHPPRLRRLYDYDLDLKPPRGHPFPAQTLGAVLEGQKRLAAAGPLRIPILVMHSSRTRIGVLFTEQMRRSDTVLDVRAIRQAALRLGPDVWVEAIDGARHDVFMSDADARVRAIATLDAWLEQV